VRAYVDAGVDVDSTRVTCVRTWTPVWTGWLVAGWRQMRVGRRQIWLS